MPGKSYKSILYHIVFSTKDRKPLLNNKIRKKVYDFILKKCKISRYYLHQIGGTEDHIHLLIYIPPKISLSKAIGVIKGSSSHYINKDLLFEDGFHWQNGYGVITINYKNFNMINEYIKNQKEHHQEGTFLTEYEKMDNSD